MKRLAIYFLTFAVMALALPACQNNGDIGDLYGTWRLDSFTIDGQPEPEIAAQTLISFQNNIIEVQRIHDSDGSFTNYFGTWADTGELMTLNFTHSYDDGSFPAPEWLGWTSQEPMAIRVSDRSSRSMTWTYTAPDGTIYVYKLHKTW